MAKEERINLELIKPRYQVGRAVYIPQKNEVIKTNILGYEIQTFEEDGKNIGVVSNYRIPQMVIVRRGEESDLVDYVKECDFYTDRKKAEEASRFLEVNADEETWKLAIGDRKVEDETSPYNLENCGLPICCANISEARDILIHCKSKGGLINHERNYLYELLTGHELEYEPESPIGRILTQLEISNAKA